MMHKGVRYSVGTLLIGLLVVGAGWRLVGSGGMRGVVWGAAAGVLVQLLVFWGLFVWALPEKRTLAYGLGAMIRFGTLAAMAFVGTGALGLPAAPTLFSMVACLFGGTLLEALFIERRSGTEVQSGAATIRT